MTGEGLAGAAGAAERTVVVNELAHHVVEWAPRGASDASATSVAAGAAGPAGSGAAGAAGAAPFVLCHGFLDLAWSFRDVAERLAAAGHRVVAFDWRGHGETAWVGAGGYYHFADYVRDLDALLPELGGGAPVHLVGHSMGGTAVSLYAGARGGAGLRTLALLEGLGPPPTTPEGAATRLRSFLDGTRREARRVHRPIADLDEALRRMRVSNPDLPDGLGRLLAAKATRPADDGGGLVWRFDPLHRTTSPHPFTTDAWVACAAAIAVPVLIVRGSRGLVWPDEPRRLAALPGARLETVEGAGHMLHQQAPERVAALLLAHAAAHG